MHLVSTYYVQDTVSGLGFLFPFTYEEIEIQKCLVRCLRPVTQLVSELNSAVSLWSPSSYAATLIPPLAHSLGKLNCKILEEKISRQVV